MTERPRTSLFRSILITGLIAGTLDISCAFIHYFILTRNNPLRILNYIASAAFDKTVYNGTYTMMIAGLLFHYLIAILFTAFYFLIFPKLKFLSKNIIVSGIGYGAFVWIVMNLVVVPLSRIPLRPFNPLQSAIGMLILIFAIGLPVSILTYRYYLKKGEQ